MPHILPAFRLRTLFGVITLVAVMLTVLVLMDSAPPAVLGSCVWLGGSMLAIVVAYRRDGRVLDRLAIGVLFSAGSFVLGGYVAFMSSMWQLWRDGGDNPGVGVGIVILILFAPIAVLMAVLLLRAWTWSAYDANPVSFTNSAKVLSQDPVT